MSISRCNVSLTFWEQWTPSKTCSRCLSPGSWAFALSRAPSNDDTETVSCEGSCDEARLKRHRLIIPQRPKGASALGRHGVFLTSGMLSDRSHRDVHLITTHNASFKHSRLTWRRSLYRTPKGSSGLACMSLFHASTARTGTMQVRPLGA